MDNNGFLDIVGRDQAEFGHKGDELKIYYQESGGKWKKFIKPIVNGEGLKLSDIDGDAKQDIVVNGFWLKNTGNIEIWEEHKFSDTWEWKNTYIDVADINDDGLSDILLAPSELTGTNYHISWFEAPKNPVSIWEEHIVVDSIETVLHFIGAADFNLDGKKDFMIARMQQGEDPDEVAIFYQKKKEQWETSY